MSFSLYSFPFFQLSMLWSTRMELWRLWTTWDFPVLSCHLHQNRSPVLWMTTAARVRHRHFANQKLGFFILLLVRSQPNLRMPSLRLISVYISIGSTPMGKRRTLQYRNDFLLLVKIITCGMTRIIGNSVVLTFRENKTAWSTATLLSPPLTLFHLYSMHCIVNGLYICLIICVLPVISTRF